MKDENQAYSDSNSSIARRCEQTRELFERTITKDMLQKALEIYELQKKEFSFSSDDFIELKTILHMTDLN